MVFRQPASSSVLPRHAASAPGQRTLFSRSWASSYAFFNPAALNQVYFWTLGLESMELFGQLKLALPLFLSVCMLVPSIQARTVNYCDKKGEYPVKVQDVAISPDPILPGKPATFTISASAYNAISRGKVVIQVSLFGVHVHTESHDLCEETSCPISVGKFELSHSQMLPGFTPPGSYTLKMKIEDERKNQLTCITFNFNIGFGYYAADS